MEFLPVDNQNRERINAFISERWLSTDMIIRGERIDLTKADGIIAMENGDIIGLLTCIIRDRTCEITSLDSLKEWQNDFYAFMAQKYPSWSEARAPAKPVGNISPRGYLNRQNRSRMFCLPSTPSIPGKNETRLWFSSPNGSPIWRILKPRSANIGGLLLT